MTQTRKVMLGALGEHVMTKSIISGGRYGFVCFAYDDVNTGEWK